MYFQQNVTTTFKEPTDWETDKQTNWHIDMQADNTHFNGPSCYRGSKNSHLEKNWVRTLTLTSSIKQNIIEIMVFISNKMVKRYVRLGHNPKSERKRFLKTNKDLLYYFCYGNGNSNYLNHLILFFFQFFIQIQPFLFSRQNLYLLCKWTYS